MFSRLLLLYHHQLLPRFSLQVQHDGQSEDVEHNSLQFLHSDHIMLSSNCLSIGVPHAHVVCLQDV